MVALAFGVLCSTPVLGQALRDPDACLKADTSTRWKEVQLAWAERPDDRWTNDSLRRRLLMLAERDQAVRMHVADSMHVPEYNRRMTTTDSANAAELMTLVAQFGWPTRSMVGARGAEAAFLIAQHSGHIQQEALKLMQGLPAGEVSRSELAMLADRVNVHDGKPQRYGTQLSFKEDGSLAFDPIEDIEHVDERRAEVGLMPLDVYICFMRAAYDRDIIDPRK